MKTAQFFFDFISPYSFLASQLLARDEYQELPLEHRPVAFGSMLARLEAKGPGEIPSRRRIGLEDVILLCRYHGIPLEGPPTHPFNSVYAMRTVCAVEDEATRRALTARFFAETWSRGRSLEDLGVLTECLKELGLDIDPEEAATTRENRAALKKNTRDALAAGAWGVPTFLVDGVVFFGHDRLPQLKAYLSGELDRDPAKLEALLARPQPGRIT